MGEAEALRAEPQPYATYRAELTEALEGGPDGAGDGFIWIEADLAVLLAPDESNRQAAAQLATCGLVANATLQARAQDVQLSFGHGAFQAEHQRSEEYTSELQSQFHLV